MGLKGCCYGVKKVVVGLQRLLLRGHNTWLLGRCRFITWSSRCCRGVIRVLLRGHQGVVAGLLGCLEEC
jgi:hypothetical protein